MHDSLERLLALRGVTFTYIDPDMPLYAPGIQTGMIAQEVERIFPEWINENAEGFKTLTYRGFEALTVEALRDLRAEKDAQIESLRQENAAQQTQLEELKKALEELRDQVRLVERR
jgi:hypothetical protein